MTGVRSEEQKAESRAAQRIAFTKKSLAVSAEAELLLGKPSRLTLIAPQGRVTVWGDSPAEAIRAPLGEAEVKERLSKMGGTDLSLAPEDISLTLDEGINLSPAAINALRRAAVAALTGTEREAPDLPSLEGPRVAPQKPLTTAVFYDPAVLYSLTKEEKDTFDIRFVPLLYYKDFPGEAGVSLPPVIMERETEEVQALLCAAAERGARWGLVSNLSHFSLCRRAGLIPIGDFRMNACNPYTAEVLRTLGAERSLCSLELTAPRAKGVGGVLAYGRAPLMLTERCFVKENAGCAACGSYRFKDRRGAEFPVMREYLHRNLIFNSLPTYMGDKKGELARCSLRHLHFIFSDESARDIRAILAAFREGAALPSAVRRIGVSEARIYGEDEKGTESEKKAPKESAAPQRSPLPKAKATPQGRPANRTKGKPSAWPSAGKKRK